MKYIIILIACALLSFQFYTINNVLADIISYTEIKEIPYVKKKTWVRSEVIKMIAYKAVENNLNPKYVINLALCESGASSTIQSRAMQKYGREQSFGVFQIHTYAHKNISVAEAIDPEFNTDWAIKEIKKGKAAQHWVACHKKAYEKI